MSIDAIIAGGHTSTSLLIYRWSRSGECELFVRSPIGADNPTYSLPFRDIPNGETALQCVKQSGLESLSLVIPDADLDYEKSAVVSNLGEGVSTRVFIVQAPRRGWGPRTGPWRGWQYEFLPLSSLPLVYLHTRIGATYAALRELVGPSPRRSWLARHLCA